MHRIQQLHRRAPGGRHQQGAVLIVGLIMLLLVTLIAVAAIRMSTTHVQVVGNEQFKAEAVNAANYALDLVINNEDFTEIDLSANPVTVNVAGDGDEGVSMVVQYSDPECSRYRFIKKSELVKRQESGTEYVYTVDEDDAGCITGVPSTGVTIVNAAVSGSIEDNSLCVTTLWDVSASVEDAQTGASVTVNQGIEMRMEITEAENKCE